MVRLIALLKRKPGTSHEEFLTYWRERHGPLVAGTKSGQHARRYEQLPSASGDTGFDGVTMQWFDSVEDFHASLREDDYGEIAADIERFLDSSSLIWMLAEEPPFVVVDGAH